MLGISQLSGGNWWARSVLEGKSDKFIYVFLSKLSDRPISPQSGEGDMHEVPRLRTKVVRGFRERVHHCPIATS